MVPLLLLCLVLASTTTYTSTVDLKLDGSAIVTCSVKAPLDAEYVELPLLAKPEVLVAYGEEGPLLADVHGNASGWFVKVYYPPRSFTLTYATVELSSYSAGFWTVNLSSPSQVDVILPEGVVPTQLPKEVLELTYTDSRIKVSLPPGSFVLEYAVLVEAPSPPAKEGLPLSLAAGLAIGIGAASTIVLWLLKRRKTLLYELDDTDKAILDFVKRRGPVSIAEVAEQLKIPRSTAHRKLRKLARYGLVSLERAGAKLMAR